VCLIGDRSDKDICDYGGTAHTSHLTQGAWYSQNTEGRKGGRKKGRKEEASFCCLQRDVRLRFEVITKTFLCKLSENIFIKLWN
jgi:hypothetical protein